VISTSRCRLHPGRGARIVVREVAISHGADIRAREQRAGNLRVARTVSRRVVPAGISAITQLTDDAFVVQTPPGMLAEVTVWLRLTESTALRTAIERCDFTSAVDLDGCAERDFLRARRQGQRCVYP
jgi:hypothetical protein